MTAQAVRAGPGVAAHLARGVLGAGMLVMPPVVAALAGDRAPAVWAAHILLGGSVSLLLTLAVRPRVGPATLAGAVGALTGRWAERLVDGAFAVAFPAGQAAIAWFTATGLVAAPDGGPPGPGPAGLLLALGILVVAVLAALSPWSPPPAVLRARPWVAGGLALACAACAWPPAGPTLATGGGVWLAFAALFFAGVGWESVTAVAPSARGVLLGTAVVATVYLGLAAVRQVGAAPAAPVRWVLAVATAVVLTSYCFTNVRTAARIAGRLLPYGTGTLVAGVGAACLVLAWIGTRDGVVPLLLLGPAVAAVVGYGLAVVSSLKERT